MAVYIARQPILDRSRRIVAYELLFRPPPSASDEGARATAEIVARVFGDPAFADALGPHPAFVNVDAQFVAGDYMELLPAQRAVVELLETIAYTPELVARLRALQAKGYRFAADDFTGDLEALAPVLPLIEIVKVDARALEGTAPEEVARRLPGKTLLAEKVETDEEAQRFARAGYALFQGYFFARPETVGKLEPDPARFAALRLLALVNGEAELAAVEDALKQESVLAVGLLRLVNSAAAGLARRVNSLREAVLLLGRNQLARWLQLLVYLGAGTVEARAHPLLQTAAVRGKTLEILARALGRSGERAYLAGLVSLFPAATGIPLERLLSMLPLDDEVVAALRARKGTLGDLLRLAEAMERADDEAVASALEALPRLTGDDLFFASAEAIAWAGRL